MSGTLYIIPSPINEYTADFFAKTELLNSIKHFIVETPKTCRANLKLNGFEKPLREVEFYELNKRTNPKDLPSFIAPCLRGEDVALLSDAGCPGVADPGSLIVSLAHKNNIPVKPFIGPNSIILALMASGFNGQKFSFEGYIPKEKEARGRELKYLENLANKTKRTFIFIETPFRSQHMYNTILETLKPETNLCIACELTSENEFIKTDSVKNWSKSEKPNLHKKPCVFLIN